ncbi:MAG: hypothetical protein IKR11_08060 [Solobacterium sp.]|nr:hypothetical protein [Solobacterium sp.]
MNERERYRRAYDALPNDYEADIQKIMDAKPGKGVSRLTAALLALLLAFTTVCAANEEIRRKFTMWILGQGVKAEIVTIDQETYEVIITMPDGEQIHTTAQSGDGPKDPEYWIELYRNLYEIKENKEGRIILYHKDTMTDITNEIKDFAEPVRELDPEGNPTGQWFKGYGFYRDGENYITIFHLEDHEGKDFYSTSVGSEYVPIYSNISLSTGEAYLKADTYYESITPIYDDTRYILAYHDEKLDITDKMKEWGYECKDWYYDEEKGEIVEANSSTVIDKYCYTRAWGKYITVYFCHSVYEDGSIDTGCGVIDLEDGYYRLEASDGTLAPAPDGPIHIGDID